MNNTQPEEIEKTWIQRNPAPPWTEIAIDLEANNLLQGMLSFKEMPYKLNDEARLWCISVRCIHTNQHALLINKDYIDLKAPTVVKKYFKIVDTTDRYGMPIKEKIYTAYEYYVELDNGELQWAHDFKVKEHYSSKEFYETEQMPYQKGIDYNQTPKRILSKENLSKVLSKCTLLLGHNIIGYDLPVLMLFDVLDYKVGYPGQSSSVFGKDCKLLDTLIISKLYNPDRLDHCGRHSLEAFGKRTGTYKIQFGSDFSKATWQMFNYCSGDTLTSVATYNYLMEEEEGFHCMFEKAYEMESKLVDLSVRRETFGFDFDSELAHKCVDELTDMLQEREDIVLPILPDKPLTKVLTDFYTPPAGQFKSNGNLSSNIIKFAIKVNNDLSSQEDTTNETEEIHLTKEEYISEQIVELDNCTVFFEYPKLRFKVKEEFELDLKTISLCYLDKSEGTIEPLFKKIKNIYTYTLDEKIYKDFNVLVNEEVVMTVTNPKTSTSYIKAIPSEEDESVFDYYLLYDNKKFKLPYHQPLKTHCSPALNDHNLVKGFLLDNGWDPSEWKVRDLTKDSKKKVIEESKVIKAIERYARETDEGPYKKFRLEELNYPVNLTFEQINDKLLNAYKKNKKQLKVITTPMLRVGATKELCPNLEKFIHNEGEPTEKNNSKIDKAFVKAIVEWHTYSHRKNSISGGTLDEDGEPTKGFLAFVREDGRIGTPADTLGASSGRYLHKNVANIARGSSLYGDKLRSLFRCGSDFAQIGFDYSSLEARIQGHYCIPYEGGSELAVDLLAEKPNSVHCKNALKLGISRDAAKSISYACVPVDNSEVLTSEGWKYYSELSEGDSILSYNTQTDQIELDSILKIHHFENKEVFSASNTRDYFECTEEHRWFGKQRRGGKSVPRWFENKFVSFKEMNSEFNILMSAEYSKTNSNMTVEEARFLGWLLADGCYKWSGFFRNKKQGLNVKVTQSIQKYIKELEEDLENIPYTVFEKTMPSNGNTVRDYLIKPDYPRNLLIKLGVEGIPKHSVDWVKIVLGMSRECRDNFLHTFYLSDGHAGNRISQNYGKIHEAVSLALYLQGNRISITKHMTNKCSVITKHSTRYLTNQKLIKQSIGVKPTFCITTNNSTFILRQNKKFISITGNCLYGAAYPKLMKMLGLSDTEAKKMYEDFWDSVAPLKALRDDLTKAWEENNKSYIVGIDGRKIRVRSQHSLINALFQSGGAICAKWSTVRIAQKLEELNLLGDCFLHSKEDVKVYNMIEYHFSL